MKMIELFAICLVLTVGVLLVGYTLNQLLEHHFENQEAKHQISIFINTERRNAQVQLDIEQKFANLREQMFDEVFREK
jgi:hypothetical protein